MTLDADFAKTDIKLQRLIDIGRRSKNEDIAQVCRDSLVEAMTHEDVCDLYMWLQDFEEKEAKDIAEFIDNNLM